LSAGQTAISIGIAAGVVGLVILLLVKYAIKYTGVLEPIKK
jgi:hypothetical protein